MVMRGGKSANIGKAGGEGVHGLWWKKAA